MRGPIQFLLVIMLVSGAGFATALETQGNIELNKDLVSARIQALREAGSQEGAETTLGSYQAVLNWLGEADVHAASEAAYLQAQTDAPQQEAEIRDRIENPAYRSPGINPSSVAELSQEDLDAELAALQLKLREAESTKSQLDEKILSEQSSAPNIQTRLGMIDSRLQELPVTAITIVPDLQPSQFEAGQWAVLAERKALNAERRSLQAQLASQPVRFSRRKAQRSELDLVLDGLNLDIDILKAELASRAHVLESEFNINIDVKTPGYEFIHQLIDGNTQLREQLTALEGTLDALDGENEILENLLLSVNDRFEGVKTLVSLAENSASLGNMLMVHWHQSDSFTIDESTTVPTREIGDHVIQRTHYEDTLNSLSNTTGYLMSGFAAVTGSPEPVVDDALLESAKGLVRSRRELLTALIAGETELVNRSGILTQNRERLNEQVAQYKAYLGSRILWVPSHPPFSVEILKNISNEVDGFFNRLTELRISRLSPMSSLGLVLAIILLALRGKIDARLRDINKKVGRVREDSILHTLRAMLLNIVRVLPVPLVLLLLVRSIHSPDSEAATYLASGLQNSIQMLMILLLLRVSCMDIGVARSHFAWPKEYCESLQLLTTRLLVWWFPLVVITAFTFRVELNSINAVLGRLLFCAVMVIFTLLMLRFLVTGSGVVKQHSRWRYWGIPLVIINGVFFVTIAALGYVYSGQTYFGMVINSLVIVVIVLFFYHTLHRWLLVVRRRLRFNEILEARQAVNENEATEVEPEEVNLVSISESVSSLLKIAAVAVAAFWLAYIWAPLFRALEIMQQVTLWTISDVSDGEAIMTSITLASLMLALLIGLFTVIAARNFPQLLTLVLRSRKDILPGTRYAMAKLLGYLIISVGVLAFLSTLGLRWDRLQWLVAALGVGIGFGLQEIIANFISGLIILFERPIRVGDVVTVGESSGQVIRIRIRATAIRDFDGKELLVPNKEFVTGRLLNWTLSDTCIREILDVGIAYGSDVRKAVAILQDVLDNHPLVVSEPSPDVIFSKFDSSSLNLTARYFFTNVNQRGMLLSDLHLKINDAFEEAGIVIAFPQLDVHFDREAPQTPPAQAAPATT